MTIYIGTNYQSAPRECQICHALTTEPYLLNGLLHCRQCIHRSESPGNCPRCSYPIDSNGECVIDLEHTRAAVQAADYIAVDMFNSVPAASFKGAIANVINQVVLGERQRALEAH